MAGAGLLTAGIVALLGVLRWLEIPAGEWIDWLVGIGGFWWLLGVTTIPWNVYFGAKRVLVDINVSKERKIQTSQADEDLAKKISRRALVVAVSLHFATAAVFGALAHFEITAMGWVGASAALLLTFAQPLAHLYRHLVETLRRMSDQARYPREDIESLRVKVDQISVRIEDLDRSKEHSWAHDVERRLNLAAFNDQNHETSLNQAKREMHDLAGRLSEDTQFLGSVRDLIRFVKEV